MKLGLGTVQFGMKYGISNTIGIPSHQEITDILSYAHSCGIRCLDTASLYNSSEEVLGATLPKSHSFKIVTKTPHFLGASISAEDCVALEKAFEKSLISLKTKSTYGLLIHDVRDLLKPGGALLIEKLKALKGKGQVEKIGASVYSAGQIDQLFKVFPKFDLIQLPLSILDQRLLQSGHLKQLKAAGMEIHARSIFLQGLLLMDSSTLPQKLGSVKHHLEQMHLYFNELGLTLLQAAVQFVTSIPEVDQALVGVCSKQQLSEIILALEKMPKRPPEYAAWAFNDEKVLNPSLWG